MPLQKKISPRIYVDNEEALVDDVITIRVTGLEKHQHITVYTSLKQRKVEFAACGCFRADVNGEVDLTQSPSLQGTYTGVSAMGLFWSMEPVPGSPKGMRLFQRNASRPLNTTIRVLKGHLSLEEIYDCSGEPVAEKKIRRWYLAKDVRKIPVKEGRIRGTLFLPPGDGPFPGLIEMFGGAGSLVEFRAALLASRGFACLALAYFDYEDLPKRLGGLQMEYFLEACDWLCAHPSVMSDGIGAIGVSKGGEISMRMGYHSPKVKAVVNINGAPFPFADGMSYNGHTIPSPKWDLSDIELTNEGLRYFNFFDVDIDKAFIVPLWTRDVKTLLIIGGDDQCVNCQHLLDFSEYYPREKKHNVELVVYPGAGHIIEPPYSPFCRSSYSKSSFGEEDAVYLTFWGGYLQAHAHAQEDSWRRILQFLKQELTTATRTTENSAKSRL